MMQIVWMSVRLGNALHPALEQRPRIVRARPGLGMELERARPQLRELEALDGLVVERVMACVALVFRAHGKAVVLARHEHAARLALEHRMIRAAVAEREL